MSLLIKYNDNRVKRYQTKTVVKSGESDNYVEKTPLTKEAEAHISSFPKKKEWSEFLFPKIKSLPCEKMEEGIRYPFLEGKPLDHFLTEQGDDVEAVIEEMKRLISEYYEINPKARGTWEETDEFKFLFGDVDCRNENCVRPANIDMIFDNVVVDEKGNATAYDYEWTFDISVPEKYLIYRVIAHVYDANRSLFEGKISMPELVLRFGIEEDSFRLYAKMEQNLIEHVYDMSAHEKERMEEEVDSLKADLRDVRQLLKKTEDELDKAQIESDRLSVESESLSFEYQWYRSDSEKQKLKELQQKDSEISQKDLALNQKEEELREKQNEIDSLRGVVGSLQQELERITGSKSWKMTEPIRKIKRVAKGESKKDFTVNEVENNTPQVEAQASQIASEENDITANFFRAYRPSVANAYEHAVSEEVLAEQREKGREFSSQAKISVITPLYNTDLDFLRVMIESVIAQTYPNWEFCLVDFSPKETTEVERIAREYADRDERIKFVRDYDNKGIAENTNTCIAMATGEYIAILDHDDMLDPTAFFEVMKEIEEGADFIYSDEGKFEGDLDHMMVPYFKNDYASEELAVHNFICHLNVYKKSLIDEVGGYRKEFDGSQDHDVVLRLTEKAKKIVHIRKLLYYWRMSSTSVATDISAKPYATISGIKAVNEHYKRLGLPYTVSSIRDNIPCYQLHTPVHEESVHVVIWDCENKYDLMKTVGSVLFFYDRPVRFSVIGKSTFNLLTEEPEIPWAGIYVQPSMELRRDQINNIMLGNKEDYYLFIKAGVEFVSANPIHKLLDYATIPGVAASDAFVKFRADYIYSAGVLASKKLVPPIQLRGYGYPMSYEGYETDYIHARNASAVLGVCTMIKKKEWVEIDLGKTVIGNPFVAQSLHAYEKGYRLVADSRVKVHGKMAPYMKEFALYKYEEDDIPEEEKFFNEKIKQFMLE